MKSIFLTQLGVAKLCTFARLALVTFVFNLLSIQQTQAQELTQTVRGVVLDKISQTPIIGAVVQIDLSGKVLASSSDSEGKFYLAKVPVGKQTVKVSMMGYKTMYMQQLSVNSGKELVLTLQMEEDIAEIAEVEVTAKQNKNKALNEMSTVSTRAFSVEETQKFAAAVNDPARMAQSFAGVVGGPDGNNIISIRGNSPNGLLWRMEGVEIPNPNHFANVATSGGGISILSAQLLNNSDFSTGAFAAEYGNALSGVFDLRLRKGNNQKREYTVQLGLLGLDLAAEGPFKKGYDGSYLINYRYSTLSGISKVGVNIGDAVTNFQDLSFNVYLPTKKLGAFTVFGFGGLSDQTTVAKKDTSLWKEDPFNGYNSRFYSNTGAVGITHTKLFSNQSYLKTVAILSGNNNGYSEEKMLSDFSSLIKEYEQSYLQSKSTLSSVYTVKVNARNNVRSGIILSLPQYSLLKRDRDSTQKLVDLLDVKGNTQTGQVFSQWNHKVNEKLSFNFGLHYFHLFLNNSNSIEPRAAIKYEASTKHIWTMGYGLHSQLQPMGVYFSRNYTSATSYDLVNKNLGLSKAHHLVFGYDHVLNTYSHLKTEVYFQQLYNIPIGTGSNGNYSILNAIDGFDSRALVNKGLGRNYGLELTYERFLHRDLYYLVSASLYESKFKAQGNKWFDTRFNTNFALSITGGKDWTFVKGEKNRVFGVSIKTLFVGGFRYTPVDLEASIAAGDTRYKENELFEKQIPAYFRTDVRISLKRNYKKVTTVVALDIQNASNRKNVGGQYFDLVSGSVKYWYQTPLIPVLSYRLEF